jgi:hypothetical protein
MYATAAMMGAGAEMVIADADGQVSGTVPGTTAPFTLEDGQMAVLDLQLLTVYIGTACDEIHYIVACHKTAGVTTIDAVWFPKIWDGVSMNIEDTSGAPNGSTLTVGVAAAPDRLTFVAGPTVGAQKALLRIHVLEIQQSG